MSEKPKPDLTNPLDIKAFLFNELGVCGCVALPPMLETIRDFLIWADGKKEPGNQYHNLFGGNIGTYYLVATALDKAGLIEHGVSIRYPSLSETGRALLEGIKTNLFFDIDDAFGTAYDGAWYGEDPDNADASEGLDD